MLRLVALVPALFGLSACVVTAPAKVVWSGAKLAGSGVYYTGKGVYQMGKLTVRVADGVLDGTERMLRLVILTADATGAVARSTREVNATMLEMELAALERTEGVIEVIVEPVVECPQLPPGVSVSAGFSDPAGTRSLSVVPCADR